jgi:hypothetical protein
MQAEGIVRPTAGLTDEVRQRERRHARAADSAADGDPAEPVVRSGRVKRGTR